MHSSGHRTLLVIRHAHRNKTFGSAADNGLSAKGRQQVRRLTRYFFRRFSKRDVRAAWVVSSPKLRCLETIAEIAHRADVLIENDERLGEGTTVRERAEAFRREWLKRKEPLTILCSHGDWIPAFLDAVLGYPLELEKGGWAEIARENRGAPGLRLVIQDFRDVG